MSSAYRNSLTQLTLLRIHQGIFRAILDPFGLGGLSRLLLMDVTSHISHIQIELSKKRRKKEKKLHQYSFPLIEMLLLSGFIKTILPHFLQVFQNKVPDNSSLLFVTLSSDNQLPVRSSSRPVLLLADAPPRRGSSWPGLLLGGAPPGRGSSWAGSSWSGFYWPVLFCCFLLRK